MNRSLIDCIVCHLWAAITAVGKVVFEGNSQTRMGFYFRVGFQRTGEFPEQVPS